MATNETIKRVFLHHIDDYECNELRKHLMEVNRETNCMKYDIFGSLHFNENLSKVMNERHPLEIFNFSKDNFATKVLTCDFLVFNISINNFEKACYEMRKVMHALEEYHRDAEKQEIPAPTKYIMLLSSPITWAMTVLNKDDEDDAVDFYVEKDYRRRRAHKNYCKYKLLERDVIWLQKKCKNSVKSVVVCPGIPYGLENNIFHYIFKYAYYNQQIPILKPGTQMIPIVHIKDLVRILQKLIDKFPEPKLRYILAVQPTHISLKSFTYNICKAFNEDQSKVRFLDREELLAYQKELFPQTVVDILALNMKMVPTYLNDFDFTKVNDEFWIKLAQEFRNSKNFRPVKIVIDGPALVGKTEHARILSEYYQIPYVNTSRIISTYIKFLEAKLKDIVVVLECLGLQSDKDCKIDDEDLEVVEDLNKRAKFFTKELFDLKVYYASHKDLDEQDFEMVSKYLIALISMKQYNLNQGYVIDNFPFTYDQANKIFYNTQKRIYKTTFTGEEYEGIEEEGYLDDVEDLFDNNIKLEPTHVVILDASDDLLCKRAMSFTETEAIIRRCLRHQMLARLDAYRDRDEGPHCLATLFYDHDLIPLHIQVEEDTPVTDTIQVIKNEIGPPFVYPLSDVEQKILNDKILEKEIKEKAEQAKKAEQLTEQLIAERERKLLEWTQAYKKIREKEDELNAIKTLPLRQYLDKFVLPTLTDGILKVAELKPDDPVDFLAEYLFKHNPEGQQAPPFCTTEQRKRFEEMFYKEINFDDSITSLLQPPECDEISKT